MEDQRGSSNATRARPRGFPGHFKGRTQIIGEKLETEILECDKNEQNARIDTATLRRTTPSPCAPVLGASSSGTAPAAA